VVLFVAFGVASAGGRASSSFSARSCGCRRAAATAAAQLLDKRLETLNLGRAKRNLLVVQRKHALARLQLLRQVFRPGALAVALAPRRCERLPLPRQLVAQRARGQLERALALARRGQARVVALRGEQAVASRIAAASTAPPAAAVAALKGVLVEKDGVGQQGAQGVGGDGRVRRVA